MHYFKRLLEIFRAFSQELKNNLVTKGCENFELQEIQLLEEGKGFGSTPSTLLEHVSSSLLPRKIGTSTSACKDLIEDHCFLLVVDSRNRSRSDTTVGKSDFTVESHLRVIVHKRFGGTEIGRFGGGILREKNRIELLEKLKDVVEEALGENSLHG
ncbi:hypothetical protein Tco_0339086 [Tanacetum coccineum]